MQLVELKSDIFYPQVGLGYICICYCIITSIVFKIWLKYC